MTSFLQFKQLTDFNHSWSTFDLLGHNTVIDPLKSLSYFLKNEKNKLLTFNNWFVKNKIKLIELYIEIENIDKYQLNKDGYKKIIEDEIIDFAKQIFDTGTYLPIMYNNDMVIEFNNDLSYRTYTDRHTLASKIDSAYSRKTYKTAGYQDPGNKYRNILNNLRIDMEDWNPIS